MTKRQSNASREEIVEMVEVMTQIQALPQLERIAIQFYIKGIIATMSGQLPMPGKSLSRVAI